MVNSERNTPADVWLARASWLALPLLISPGMSSAIGSWDPPPRLTAEAAGWLVWAAGILALFVRRPVALTAVRIASMWALVGSGLLVGYGSITAVLAFLMAVVVLLGATRADFAHFMINGAAFGNEDRHVLATPPLVAFVVAPLLVLGTGSALLTATLGFADRRWVLGGTLLGIATPLCVLTARSVHALARRWLVLVPGGITLHDPLALDQPVLLPASAIRSVAVTNSDRQGCVDLGLGASFPATVISLDRPLELGRRGRQPAGHGVDCVVVHPQRPGRFLQCAISRSASWATD